MRRYHTPFFWSDKPKRLSRKERARRKAARKRTRASRRANRGK